MVRYEFSKDFKTWVSKVNEQDVHDLILEDSYKIVSGFTLEATSHLTNTLTFELVADATTRQEMLAFNYCKAYKDEELTFVGILDNESQTTIETLQQYAVTIKYTDFNALLEKAKAQEDIDVTIDSNTPLLLKDTPNSSLVGMLCNKIIEQTPQEIGLKFAFDIDLPRVVQYWHTDKNADLLKELEVIFAENGLDYYFDNTTIRVFDVLVSSAVGHEIYDIESDAKVTTHNWVNTDVPPVQGVTYETKNVEIFNNYDDSIFGEKWYTAGEVSFFGKLTLSANCTIPNADNGRVVTNVKITNVKCDAFTTPFEYTWDNEARTITLVGGTRSNIAGSYHGIIVNADVTYRIPKVFVKAADNPDAEPVVGRTIYTEDDCKRYIDSLKIRKKKEASNWTFYTQEKLTVGQIVRIKDVPHSEVRIYQIEDSADAFGGCVYHAYPQPEGVTKWEEAKIPALGLDNGVFYPISLSPSADIRIQNGKFVHPTIRFYILCNNPIGQPYVYYKGALLDLKLDAMPENPTEEEKRTAYSNRWYFDFNFTDTAIESYVFDSAWGNASHTDVYRPIISDSMIVEYKWGASPDVPPSGADIWLWGMGAKPPVMLFNGGIIGNVFDSNWSTITPPKEAGAPFLWMRVSSDGGRTWTYSRLTGENGQDGINGQDGQDGENGEDGKNGLDGKDAVDFTLLAEQASYSMSSRGVLLAPVTLRFAVQRINTTEETVWAVQPDSLPSDSIVIDGDKLAVTLPLYSKVESVSVTASVGAIPAKTVKVEAIKAGKPQGEYWGDSKFTSLEQLQQTPTTPTGEPWWEGDSALIISGTNAIPYVYRNGAWQEVQTDDVDYAKIMSPVLNDVIKQPDIQPTSAALRGYFQHLAAKRAFIEFLSVYNLVIGKGTDMEGFKFSIIGADENGLLDTPTLKCTYNGVNMFSIDFKEKQVVIGDFFNTGGLLWDGENQRMTLNGAGSFKGQLDTVTIKTLLGGDTYFPLGDITDERSFATGNVDNLKYGLWVEFIGTIDNGKTAKQIYRNNPSAIEETRFEKVTGGGGPFRKTYATRGCVWTWEGEIKDVDGGSYVYRIRRVEVAEEANTGGASYPSYPKKPANVTALLALPVYKISKYDTSDTRYPNPNDVRTADVESSSGLSWGYGKHAAFPNRVTDMKIRDTTKERLFIENLPTQRPSEKNRVYRDNGYLKIT